MDFLGFTLIVVGAALLCSGLDFPPRRLFPSQMSNGAHNVDDEPEMV
jgi:hypothetical protein